MQVQQLKYLFFSFSLVILGDSYNLNYLLIYYQNMVHQKLRILLIHPLEIRLQLKIPKRGLKLFVLVLWIFGIIEFSWTF